MFNNIKMTLGTSR